MRTKNEGRECDKPILVVLASTYPRWEGDPEPAFVHELCRRLCLYFKVIALVPHAPGAQTHEFLSGVNVVRYRYAPMRWETLVNDGGIVANLKRRPIKLLLVPGFVLIQAWQLWRLTRRQSVALVHAHWLIPQGLIAAVLRGKVPYVVTAHGADLFALRGQLMRRLKLWVVERAQKVTVVSRAMRASDAFLPHALDKVHVQPMGVDMRDRFVPDRSVHREEAELLFVGRLVEKKGLKYLLHALPLLLLEFPHLVLRVVGFGPEEDVLKQHTETLGLAAHVCFLGPVPQEELPKLYQRASLLVAPFVQARSGDQEGLGLVVVEATACLCPVLAGNVPAMEQVYGDSWREKTVNVALTTLLAERVAQILREPAQAQAQARALRLQLLEQFDWSSVAQAYGRLLLEACQKEDFDRV